MGLIGNLRGPQGPQGLTGPQPVTVNLAGQVDTTGVSDATSVFASAVASLPTYGGTISLPAGQIKGVFSVAGKAVRLVGQGGSGGPDVQGHGVTELLVPDGQVGFTFGVPGAYVARGPIIQFIRFRGVGTSPAPAGAVFLNGGVGGGVLDCCGISEAFTTYGIRIVGGTTVKNTSYFAIRDCQVTSKLGLDIQYTSGVQVRGSTFDAGGNGAITHTVVPGSTGIKTDTHTDTLSVLGTRFQGYETHVDTRAPYTAIRDTRHELFTTAIKVAADGCKIDPASMANSGSLTGTGTGLYLVSGSYIYANVMCAVAVATRVNYGAAQHYYVLDKDGVHSTL